MDQPIQPTEYTLWNYLTTRGRLLVEVFLAGTGLMAWIVAIFFSPMNEVKADIRLIQKDISVIQTNHERHIEILYEELGEMKVEIKEQNVRLENQNEAIIRLLQIHNR